MVVSNTGVVQGFSSLYTTNSAGYTSTVQVVLEEAHLLSTFDYMERVQKEIAEKLPDIRTFFSSGSMVDAILNSGMPAPIDVQVSGGSLKQSYSIAQDLAGRLRQLRGVGEVYIPQDLDYPGIRLK